MSSILNLTTAIWRYLLIAKSLLNPIVLFALVFLSAIWAIIFAQQHDEEQRNELELAGQAINLALVFEQNVIHTIGDLDKLMIVARGLERSESRSVLWSTVIRSNFFVSNGLADLSIVNASGEVVATTLAIDPGVSVNMADRPIFKAQKRGITDQLLISPQTVGRVSKKNILQLARALRTPTGEFEGIILISLSVETIFGTYRTLELGQGGGMALIGTDDIYRAGTGIYSARAGRSYRERASVSRVGVRSMASADPLNTVEKQIVDGQPRLVVVRSVKALPLQVAVTISHDADAVTWSPMRAWYFAFASFCSLALILSTVKILRSQTQAATAAAQLGLMEVEKQVAQAAAVDRAMFLAVMSHEIRTPINGILGALDLVRGGSLDQRDTRCIRIATECGETLLGLIDDILLFSKSENGQIDVALEPFSLGDLCDKVLHAMLSITTRAGNIFTVDVGPEAYQSIRGDAGRLRQVLVNLIGNANKFTKGGSIVLRVESISQSDDLAAFAISVIDTGIGIPEEKHAVIFNQFQTLDPSYTRRTDGTGLGLAICDKLVRAMGGEIKLKSELGRGSCFAFKLQFARAQKDDGPAAADAAQQAGPAGKTLRILLAEDNPTNAYVVTEFLNDAGHQVRYAKNGREAVALAVSEEFDVILMDISMPEMSGIEATKRIRALAPPNSTVPIIALTAHVALGEQTAFLDAKMNGYLTKPVRKSQLLNAVYQTEIVPLAPRSVASPAVSIAEIADRPTISSFIRDRSIARAIKIIGIFIAELGVKIVDLRQIIERRDETALSMLAHSVIGSGSLLGAARLVDKGRAIEAAVNDGGGADWTEAECLASILAATIEVFAALNSEAALLTLVSESRPPAPRPKPASEQAALRTLVAAE